MAGASEEEIDRAVGFSQFTDPRQIGQTHWAANQRRREERLAGREDRVANHFLKDA